MKIIQKITDIMMGLLLIQLRERENTLMRWRWNKVDWLIKILNRSYEFFFLPIDFTDQMLNIIRRFLFLLLRKMMLSLNFSLTFIF